MARYTGTRPLGDHLAGSLGARWIRLPTDNGEYKIKVTNTEGDIVTAQTDDGKLVTIDLGDPDHITIT